MLTHVPTTIPAEIRDYPEWHHGRKTYAVWTLQTEDEAIHRKFSAAREYLNGYLLEPYRRQPHVTLFVCGFLVNRLQFDDDFTPKQVQSQIKSLESAKIQPFKIEIGGLNSFASAPFLEVNDLENGIARLREVLSHGAREFRTAPFTPHLTVGLYAGAFPNKAVTERIAGFPNNLIRCKVERTCLATYQADEIAGPLTHKHEFTLIKA